MHSWCGVVWCDVLWRGAVWCGMMWCNMMWCGVMWCDVVWCCVMSCGAVRCGLALRDGVVWCAVFGVMLDAGVMSCVMCGAVWCIVWCGVVCGAWCGVVCSVAWCGVVWCGVVWCVVWCARARADAMRAWIRECACESAPISVCEALCTVVSCLLRCCCVTICFNFWLFFVWTIKRKLKMKA